MEGSPSRIKNTFIILTGVILVLLFLGFVVKEGFDLNFSNFTRIAKAEEEGAGEGQDECDPEDRFSCGHLACDRSGKCRMFPGKGENKCTHAIEGEQCRRYVCEEGKCVLKPVTDCRVTRDECRRDKDCASLSYNIWASMTWRSYKDSDRCRVWPGSGLVCDPDAYIHPDYDLIITPELDTVIEKRPTQCRGSTDSFSSWYQIQKGRNNITQEGVYTIYYTLNNAEQCPGWYHRWYGDNVWAIASFKAESDLLFCGGLELGAKWCENPDRIEKGREWSWNLPFGPQYSFAVRKAPPQKISCEYDEDCLSPLTYCEKETENINGKIITHHYLMEEYYSCDKQEWYDSGTWHSGKYCNKKTRVKEDCGITETEKVCEGEEIKVTGISKTCEEPKEGECGKEPQCVSRPIESSRGKCGGCTPTAILKCGPQSPRPECQMCDKNPITKGGLDKVINISPCGLIGCGGESIWQAFQCSACRGRGSSTCEECGYLQCSADNCLARAVSMTPGTEVAQAVFCVRCNDCFKTHCSTTEKGRECVGTECITSCKGCDSEEARCLSDATYTWKEAIHCGVPQTITTEYCAPRKDNPATDWHTQCKDNKCVIVKTKGRNECENDDHCEARDGVGGDWYMTCENNQCKKVKGKGTNMCRSNEDCDSNTEVIWGIKCTLTASFSGNCLSGEEMFAHPGFAGNVVCEPPSINITCEGDCRMSKKDKKDGENGEEEEELPEGYLWGQWHTVCTEDKKCERRDGIGYNECRTNEDCTSQREEDPSRKNWRTVCTNDDKCEVVNNEKGYNECRTDADCPSVEPNGGGKNWHTECIYNKCQVVRERGDNECRTDEDCSRGVYKRCTWDNKCIEINGTRESDCNSKDDCLIERGHRICVIDIYNNYRCVQESGEGDNECNKDEDCPNTDRNYHYECVYDKKCRRVEYSGVDECRTDNDCAGGESKDWYTYCNEGKCLVGDIKGENCCRTNKDCPPVLKNLRLLEPYCVGLNGAGIIYFKWDYIGENKQAKFHFQVAEDKEFQNVVVDVELESTATQFPVYVVPKAEGNSNSLEYNKDYYWRVEAEDVRGLSSGWVYYNGSTHTSNLNEAQPCRYRYTHPAPFPIYSAPSVAEPGETVSFVDFSTCYEYDKEMKAIAPRPCKEYLTPSECSDEKCYTWNFGDGSEEDNTIGDVFHVYTTPSRKSYLTKLRICDELGCCESTKPISVPSSKAGEAPRWREISPF